MHLIPYTYVDEVEGCTYVVADGCSCSSPEKHKNVRQIDDKSKTQILLSRQSESGTADIELWQPYVSYLELVDNRSSKPQGISGRYDVVPIAAGSQYIDQVRDLLLRALHRGYSPKKIDTYKANNFVNELLSDPDVLNYVVLDNDKLVGQITLVVDQEMTNIPEQVTILYDFNLVENVRDAKSCQSIILFYASQIARHRGQPLIGNVVHPRDNINGQQRSHLIHQKLQDNGWRDVGGIWARVENQFNGVANDE